MRIPYVIDNQSHRLADVLNALLTGYPVQGMDIATGYFSVRGFARIKDGLAHLSTFRLLLGAEPQQGSDIGLGPVRWLRQELNRESFDRQTLALVEELVAFLRRPGVEMRLYGAPEGRRGFLHAKCYLLYGGQGARPTAFDRINPLVAIVGSSNLTAPGLTTNHELNTVHKTILEPDEVDDAVARGEVQYLADGRDLAYIEAADRRLVKSEVGARAILDLSQWFQELWEDSRDYKDQLIDLLEESKFGRHEYTPYEIYLKALFTYFEDDLGREALAATRTAVELAQFQEDAVRKARQILARYDGVMVADSVGLGKTWIGKRLLEDFAYHLRQKALVICPASLRVMWQTELRGANIAAEVLSQEELGQVDFDLSTREDADVVLVDESHNFRNPGAQRYGNLERLIAANGRRGRDGGRKKVILLTATPINNTIFDLYYQLNLFTGGDRSYFASAGIGDLFRYFVSARQASREDADVELFNLLEEVVIRRSRRFIRQAYDNATIAGKPIHWPERRLRTVHYDLEQAYQGLYEDVVARIDSLFLTPYSLEAYRLDEKGRDEFELGREQALVGIFKTRLLKRFESSVAAFRISVRRALEYLKTFDTYLDEGRLMDSANFRVASQWLEREGDDDQTLPTSLADAMDQDGEVATLIADLATLDVNAYNLRLLRSHLHQDIEALTDVWYRIRDIGPARDAKLTRLKDLLRNELRGRKVLVFTYYKDTARYLGEQMAGDAGREFRRELGDVVVRRIDGGTAPSDRQRVVQAFAPRANGRSDITDSDREIDLLIATDVLSEGQNLQDAGTVLNYDLHWNPTRMVQRAGRIDRLGSPFDELWVYNMFPDQGLEKLLHLVQSLTAKIKTINTAGFLDASVLGEEVSPRDFNTLRRIRAEDNNVIEEEEDIAELASSESLLRQLQQALATAQVREWIEGLPDGIHSGLLRDRARGLFFYYTADRPATVGEDLMGPTAGDSRSNRRLHFWRYYDLETRRVLDNRYHIANMIQCRPDTSRHMPLEEIDVFSIQEVVVANILGGWREQGAVEAAPKQVDPVQTAIITHLRGCFRSPAGTGKSREDLLGLVRFLGQPLPKVHVRRLRVALSDYEAGGDETTLVAAASEVQGVVGQIVSGPAAPITPLCAEDLHLVCFEYVWD